LSHGNDRGVREADYRIANVSPATLSDGSFDKLQVNNPPVADMKLMFFNIPGCKPMVSQPGKYTCSRRSRR
jgi:hypothetical protein